MGKGLLGHQRLIFTEAAFHYGIHKPILTALYLTHPHPVLPDGDTGLGITPANRIPLEQVNSLVGQVYSAANSVRSLIDFLGEQGWRSGELWDHERGRYGDRFIQTLAKGYLPPSNEPLTARIESCDGSKLLWEYIHNYELDIQGQPLPSDLSFLDSALLSFTDHVPQFYLGTPAQRQALLTLVRTWRRLDSDQAAMATLLASNSPIHLHPMRMEPAGLDQPLMEFIHQLGDRYGNFPPQREALLQLVQLWRELESRESAIISLYQSSSPQITPEQLDSALIAFIHSLPRQYRRKKEQRYALTESYRIWHGFHSPAATLIDLGINPDTLTQENRDHETLSNAVKQLDRALLSFSQQVSGIYHQQEQQRQGLLKLVQLWQQLPDRDGVIEFLTIELKRMAWAPKDGLDAPPVPTPVLFPNPPDQWTPDNLQMHSAIITTGSFTWADATLGGTYLPPDQVTVDAIVSMAQRVQPARDRLGRPFHIFRWYVSPTSDTKDLVNDRHFIGDAIDFWIDGLTGSQMFWALDPWWPGGLGKYRQFPYRCYLDARPRRTRWQFEEPRVDHLLREEREMI